jgi:hypothetical protein
MTSTRDSSDDKWVTKSLNERKRRYEEYGKILSGTAEIVKPLRNMVGEKTLDGKAKESKLIATGIALIALPDPGIGELVGAGMVAAGLIKNKTKPLTAADVCDKFQKVTKDISKLKREMMLSI